MLPKCWTNMIKQHECWQNAGRGQNKIIYIYFFSHRMVYIKRHLGAHGRICISGELSGAEVHTHSPGSTPQLANSTSILPPTMDNLSNIFTVATPQNAARMLPIVQTKSTNTAQQLDDVVHLQRARSQSSYKCKQTLHGVWRCRTEPHSLKFRRLNHVCLRSKLTRMRSNFYAYYIAIFTPDSLAILTSDSVKKSRQINNISS